MPILSHSCTIKVLTDSVIRYITDFGLHIFYTVLPNRYIGDYVQKKINEDKILKCLTFIASYEEFTDGNSARFSNNRIGEKKANFNHSIIEL